MHTYIHTYIHTYMLNEGSNWQIDVHTQLHKRLLSQEMWRWITDDDHRGTPPPNLVLKVNRFCTLRHMYTSVALGKTLQDDVLCPPFSLAKYIPPQQQHMYALYMNFCSARVEAEEWRHSRI